MDLRMRDDCIKNEKIDGIIYDMSPAADFRHGLINSSIHSAIKTGLKGSICRVFMENLDLYYAKDSDDYVRPGQLTFWTGMKRAKATMPRQSLHSENFH